MNHDSVIQRGWINNPSYDLLFIFGGAVLTLLVPLIVTFSPVVLVPVFFWIWVFAFEGSHFWATLSRTYLDKDFVARNSPVLVGSLLFFVFPALAVLLTNRTGSEVYMNGYGFFIFTWSLYHNTRQHYGFVSLYHRRSESTPETLKFYRWGIYLACFSPMLQFFLNYKLKGDFPAIFGGLQTTSLGSLLIAYLSLTLVTVSVAYFIFLSSITFADRKKGSPIALGYILLCMVFYNVMFFWVAANEPFFIGPKNGAQMLMIVAIMNSLFHNIQYHAIVYHYSRKRYLETSDKTQFGWAQKINSHWSTYAVAALTFSVFFSLVFWFRAEIPFLNGAVSSSFPTDLAFIVYFGIVGHHFYLDQKIWKVSKSRELSSYFSLKNFLGDSRTATA